MHKNEEGHALVGTLSNLIEHFGSMMIPGYDDVMAKDAFAGYQADGRGASSRFSITVYSDTKDREVAQIGRQVYRDSQACDYFIHDGGGFYVENRELATRILAMPTLVRQMLYETFRKAFSANSEIGCLDIEVKWSRIGRRRTLRVYGSPEARYYTVQLV